MHVLDINGVSHCVLFPRPRCRHRRPPGPASSGAGSRPIAAVALAPVVCRVGTGYRRRWRDPIPPVIGPGGLRRRMPAKGSVSGERKGEAMGGGGRGRGWMEGEGGGGVGRGGVKSVSGRHQALHFSWTSTAQSERILGRCQAPY